MTITGLELAESDKSDWVGVLCSSQRRLWNFERMGVTSWLLVVFHADFLMRDSTRNLGSEFGVGVSSRLGRGDLSVTAMFQWISGL